MASSSSVDYQRRQELQQRRRHNLYRAIWRSLVAGSVAAGLWWAVASPRWVIETEEQIAVEGNQFLSDRAIRSLLALSYPQSIIQLNIQQLIQQLKTTAPVTNAIITRQLLPPKLSIAVKERPPVAVVVTAVEELGPVETGYLDSQGILVSIDQYKRLDPAAKPSLQVIGFQPQYQQYWTRLYELIRQSQVFVSTVNLQNPSNLTLETALGIVHLGANPSLLSKQIAILSQLQPLPAQLKREKTEIVLIDLTNPESPELQLAQLEQNQEN
ncbi:MAG: cell division protein FtsQ/DivIB [Cyanophyceae cyanobacterium]